MRRSQKLFLFSSVLIIVFVSGLDSFWTGLQPTDHILPTLAVLPTALPILSPAREALPSQPLIMDQSVEPQRPELVALPLVPAPTDVPASDRLVIEFAPGTSEADRRAYLAQIGAVVVDTLPALNSVVVKLSSSSSQRPQTAIVLSQQPDAVVQAQMTPNDPLYSQQWGLAAVKAAVAWDRLPANGPSVTVAVIDSGVCDDHPDLVGHVLMGWSFVDDSANTRDDFGHGCAVSGILAAQSNNALGMAGLAPNIQILPLKVLDAHGMGLYSNVAAAMVYAVDHGAQVINLSLGGTQPLSLLENAVSYATVHNVKIVAAAGNGGSATLLYPAAYADVIAVGAVDANLQRSSFSNYGAGMDALAPGRDIIAPTISGGYARYSGTSFAAPFVTGMMILGDAIGEPLVLNGQVVSFASSAVDGPIPPDQTPVPPAPSQAIIDDEVRAALAQNGQVRVMIALTLPPSAQGDGVDTAPMIAQAQNDVMAQLAPTDFVLAQQYVTIPALAGTITIDSLAILQRQPDVARVYIDEPVEQASARSVIAIRADQVQTGVVNGLNLTGAGVNVAVIDSGVDMSNPSVADDVVYQQCFSSENHCLDNLTGKPNKPESQRAPDETLHGTGIAAIITAPQGVAPDAGIVAIKVLDKYGRGYNSDWVRALDWVVQSRKDELTDSTDKPLHIDVVNISLATSKVYKPDPKSLVDSCDLALPVEAAAIGEVLKLKVSIFAAAGNQGFSDSIGAPGCFSGVIAVGAVYDSNLGQQPPTGTYASENQGSWPACSDASSPDQIACFSNSNRWLDVLAPGAQIAIGGILGTGTSEATPHAAGTAVLMIQGFRQIYGDILTPSPTTIASVMRGTGPFVTDSRNGLTFRRLDARAAVENLITPTGFTSCDRVIGIPSSECEGLVAFYTALNGPGWVDKTGWLATNTPCTWYGITCGVNTVTSISMLDNVGNGIKGQIPADIGKLKGLQVFDFIQAQFSGSLPPEIGQLTRLTRLRMARGALSGALPSEIGRLTNLETLSFRDNLLSGPVPPEIGKLVRLNDLDLSRNQLTSLPPQIGQLSSLLFLNISANQLTSLPPEIGTLTQLTDFAVGSNQLTVMPLFIKNLVNLTSLNVGFNNLSGSIPSEWSALSKLKILDLSRNDFSGSFPLIITQFTKLESLDISSNQLTGSLPAQIGNLTALKQFNLYYNSFTGPLPAAFSSLNALTLLNAEVNQFTGPLPDISAWSQITTIDFSFNQLSGSLPASFGRSTLRTLNLSHNQLSGPLPSQLSLMGPATVDLAENQFTMLPSNVGQTVSLNMMGNALTDFPLGLTTNTGIVWYLQANHLNPTDPTVIAYLNTHASGWMNNQIHMPTNLAGVLVGDKQVLTWDAATGDFVPDLYEVRIGDGSTSQTVRLPKGVLTYSFSPAPAKTYTFEVRSVVLATTMNPIVSNSAAYNFAKVIQDHTSEYTAAVMYIAPASICSTLATISTPTCTALEALYHATAGQAWSNRTNWLVGEDVCTWYGITCLGSVIVGLDLHNNNLVGTIPPEIGSLTGLKTLDLSQNDLSGNLPPQIGNLINLTSLNLNNANQITNIPSEIGNLTNLITLNLSSAQLIGPIPASIGNLTNLQYLTLSTVSGGPAGALPQAISSLTQLKVLNLAHHRLRGVIPASIGSLTRLEYLDLSGVPSETYDAGLGYMVSSGVLGEQFTGAIPSSIGNLTALTYLNLDHNKLSGLIPTQLGNLMQLKTLRIEWYYGANGAQTGGNEGLTGGLPTQLANLTQLEVLSITRQPQLQGAIPPGLANLSQLKILDLSKNQLQGPIPAQLGNLANLQLLDLSQNALSGSIPAALGNLTALTTLNMASNDLSGPIPPQLASGTGAQALESLNLSFNALSGSIPSTFDSSNFPTLTLLDVRNNALQGDIPLSLTTLPIPAPDATHGLYVEYNRLTATNPTVIAYLNLKEAAWGKQILPPGNFQMTNVNQTNISLAWTPQSNLAGGAFAGGYRVSCAVNVNGPYTPATDDIALFTANSVDIPHSIEASVYYCRINTWAKDNNSGWNLTSDDSPTLAIVIPQVFIPVIDVGTLPGIYAVDIPDGTDPEDTSNSCSEETGRAMSFRGSGRAMSFRGSGRAMSFRGSGDTQLINANTEGSAFDTVLMVFRVPVDAPFTDANAQVIACNDNSTASTSEPGPVGGVERPPSSPSFTSNVSVPFDENYDLYFVVFARDNESGELKFTIDRQAGTIAGTPAAEVAALRDFYGATNGSGWAIHTNWFSTNDPCFWYGISCNAGGSIQQINLASNRLQGPLPASLSALTSLNTLNVQGNALTGPVPASLPTSLTMLQLQNNALSGPLPLSLTALTNLTTLNLSYNALYSTDAGLTTFLNNKQSGWNTTQTVAPGGIAAGTPTTSTIPLSWTPILYTGDQGGYEIGCRQSVNDPSLFSTLVANKTSSAGSITNLLPGTAYLCTARTHTPVHGSQTNDLMSSTGTEVSGTTLLPTGLAGSGGQYTLSGLLTSFTLHANTETVPLSMDTLPRPLCATLPGHAVGIRGTHRGPLVATTNGTDFVHTLSLWVVPVGAPLSEAISIGCQNGVTGAVLTGDILAGYDYYVMVTGAQGAAGLLNLVISSQANQAPVTSADTYSTPMNSPLVVAAPGVMSNDSDPEAGRLQTTLLETVQHGTLNLNSTGRFLYRPQTGYVGQDSFTYRACDALNACAESAVTLNITAAAGTPVTLTLPVSAAADLINEDGLQWTGERSSAWVGNSSSKNASVLGLRFKDLFLPPGVTITAARLEVYSPLAQTTLVKILIAGEAADQSTAFTPASPPSGRSVTNARLQTQINTPWAAGAWYSVGDVTPVLQEIINRVGWKRGGSLSLFLKGIGNAREFRRLAGVGSTAPRLVIDLVYPTLNNAPVAQNDTVRTEQNTPKIIAVLANDSDPEGDALHLGTLGVPAHGAVSDMGNGTITYTPSVGYLGADQFLYQVCDLGNVCTSGLVSVRVSAVPGVQTYVLIPMETTTDDVNEDQRGVLSGGSSVWIGGDGMQQTYLGLRFSDLPIPNGSVITGVHLELYSPLDQADTVSGWLAADASDNSAPFSTLAPSKRPLMAQGVVVNLTTPWSAGSWQNVLGLEDIFTALVNRSGWQEGGSVALILRSQSPSGRRWISSAEGGLLYAPHLAISFIAPDVGALNVTGQGLNEPDALSTIETSSTETPTGVSSTATALPTRTPEATQTPDITQTPDVAPALEVTEESPLTTLPAQEVDTPTATNMPTEIISPPNTAVPPAPEAPAEATAVPDGD